jgi:DNA-binding beta-propeller fold protein YncE
MNRTRLIRFGIALLLAACTALPSAAQVVIVSSPANGSEVPSPVHYVASASSPQCSKGIAAMRIYIADNVSDYNIKSNVIDTLLPLSPGSYNTVVQAWDNCGGVGKTAVDVTVSASNLQPPHFLFLTTSSLEGKNVMGYVVDPNTGALTLTKQGPISGVSGAAGLASDAGGYRLYVMPTGFPNQDNGSGYFIDRRNGHLSLVPGSPFSLGFSISVVAVSPSGKFVYAGTEDLGVGGPGILIFKVNPNGSLALVTNTPVPTAGSPNAIVVDPSGAYLYSSAGVIDAFSIDPSSGALTPLPGSPFVPSPGTCGTASAVGLADSFGRFLYTGDAQLYAASGFSIDPTTGTLSEVTGSPFLEGPHHSCNPIGQVTGLAVEPTGRFLYVGNNNNPNPGTISIFKINAGDGSLKFLKNTPPSYAGGFYEFGMLRPDPSGKYLYTFGTSGLAGHNPLDEVIGFAIDHSSGDLTLLPSSPNLIPTDLAEGFQLVVTP